MRRNLDFIRNSTKAFSGVLRDSSGAVDLTSATLTWRLGSNDWRTTHVTLTESDGISVTDATNGKWTVTIDPGDTDDLEPGYYQHEGRAVIGSTTYIFTSGRIRLRREIPTS